MLSNPQAPRRPILWLGAALLFAGVCAVLAGPSAQAQAKRAPLSFTNEQAAAGVPAYGAKCATCHGTTLQGSGMAVPLVGPAFQRKWLGKPADQLFAALRTMPPGEGETMPASMHVEIMAYLLRANGVAAGPKAAPTTAKELAALDVPETHTSGAGAAARLVNIPPPKGPSQLDKLTPVTSAMLKAPPPQDWLAWRRTNDAFGHSPLKDITRANAKDLRTAWSWSLPAGGNMMTPIVHDGVLYAYSFGDIVEALDARTGDLLWRHQRKLDAGANHQGKKGVAIHGNMILVPTSDLHMIALDMKTGAVIWDHRIDVGAEKGHQIKSAPLVTDSKVIIGVNGFAEVKGGNFIVAMDLATGEEAWRFHTVARPGEPGGESWNGLPLEKRSGGSVWVAGSYEPQFNLVYFGAAPTYDPMPLRALSKQPGVTNNALYTDTTLALDADTGKLVWHFQHQANDQLDHDWAFERQIMDLDVGGVRRRAVVTGGKQAIFDALDAKTGEYLFSIDLGLQNTIASIDPKTGAKTLNPAAIPAPDAMLRRISIPGICPDLLGARNLMSTSYDPTTRLLYVPLSDTCPNPYPDGPRWRKNPEAGTEDKYGLLRAVNLESGKTAWTAWMAGPPVGGALATAGGVVFVGGADRYFRAFDNRTGKELWNVRLDNAPASYPVTYSVDGQQFVAVATNEGFVHVQAMVAVAKIRVPPAAGATLWVFALPRK